jgi:DeoR/GlpR family transcriptional regulator of sugar metabolism
LGNLTTGLNPYQGAPANQRRENEHPHRAKSIQLHDKKMNLARYARNLAQAPYE